MFLVAVDATNKKDRVKCEHYCKVHYNKVYGYVHLLRVPFNL